nr:hypothetical protein [Cellulosimicrobium sp. MM]
MRARVDGRLGRGARAALAARDDRDLAGEPRAARLLGAGLLLREAVGLLALAQLTPREHAHLGRVGRHLAVVRDAGASVERGCVSTG